MELPANWKVPRYIEEGLRWLETKVSLELPAPRPETTEPAAAASVTEIAPVTSTEGAE